MELEIEERRMSGMRYYTAKPVLTTWQVPSKILVSTWRSMQDWCTDTYGPTPDDGVWTPGARWYINNTKFWFREHKDLEWFILKWQ